MGHYVGQHEHVLFQWYRIFYLKKTELVPKVSPEEHLRSHKGSECARPGKEVAEPESIFHPRRVGPELTHAITQEILEALDKANYELKKKPPPAPYGVSKFLVHVGHDMGHFFYFRNVKGLTLRVMTMTSLARVEEKVEEVKVVAVGPKTVTKKMTRIRARRAPQKMTKSEFCGSNRGSKNR